MTELEQELMIAQAHYRPAPLPPLMEAPSAALTTARATTSARRARRLEWAVAGLCGMVVTLVGMRVADRAR